MIKPIRNWWKRWPDSSVGIATGVLSKLIVIDEDIDDDTHYNDRITTALRTSDGLELSTLSDRHRRFCMKEAQKFIDDGLLRIVDNHLALTRKGLFVSDYIMSSLMMV